MGQDQGSTTPLRVGIAGYGLAGEVFHAPLIAATDGLEVAALVTTDEGRIAKARAAFLKRIMATLESYAPGIGKLVVKSEMLTAEDLEKTYGFVGGNWHHGELAVEQMLFNRPMMEVAQYATPLPGLWLAGAGSHPGGGINGAAGWNAAGAILEARA